MKKINPFLLLLIFACGLLYACNSSTSTTPAKTDASTVTDFPANSASVAAVTAFNEGMLSLDLRENLKARAAFTRAIDLDSNFAAAYLMRTNTANTAKEFADDIAAGKAHLDSTAVWEKLYGDYLTSNLAGDPAKGIQVLEQVATTYPKAARAQVDLGFAYAYDNQFGKARVCFEKALLLNPSWGGAYSAAVNDYLFNEPKDLKNAESKALKLVELAPASAGAQISLGDCYRAQNEFSKAKDAYAKAIQLDSSAPEPYYKKGHANTYLGNLDEARKDYTDGAKNDVSKSFAVLNMAYTYLYGNDARTAVKVLMDGAANPGSAPVSKSKLDNEKALCLRTAGNIAEHYNDAAQLKQIVPVLVPLIEQFYADLGTAEARLFAKSEVIGWKVRVAIAEGKLAEARIMAAQMKEVLAPMADSRKEEEYNYLLGVIALKEKKYADAITNLGKGNKRDIYIRYLLAKANEGVGNQDKAAALYKEVAAYNFNDVGNALVRTEVKKKVAAL